MINRYVSLNYDVGVKFNVNIKTFHTKMFINSSKNIIIFIASINDFNDSIRKKLTEKINEWFYVILNQLNKYLIRIQRSL